jgi:hypothetical protein
MVRTFVPKCLLGIEKALIKTIGALRNVNEFFCRVQILIERKHLRFNSTVREKPFVRGSLFKRILFFFVEIQSIFYLHTFPIILFIDFFMSSS